MDADARAANLRIGRPLIMAAKRLAEANNAFAEASYRYRETQRHHTQAYQDFEAEANKTKTDPHTLVDIRLGAMAAVNLMPGDPSPTPNADGWTITTGICPHCGGYTEEGSRTTSHAAWVPASWGEDSDIETYTTTDTFVTCTNPECGYSDANSSGY